MIVTADQRHPIEVRAKAALAEAGYPDAKVVVVLKGHASRQEFIGWDGEDDWTTTPSHPVVAVNLLRADYRVGWDAPLDVLWSAFCVAGLQMPCWRCWELELLDLFRGWWHAPCTAVGRGIEDCGVHRPTTPTVPVPSRGWLARIKRRLGAEPS